MIGGKIMKNIFNIFKRKKDLSGEELTQLKETLYGMTIFLVIPIMILLDVFLTTTAIWQSYFLQVICMTIAIIALIMMVVIVKNVIACQKEIIKRIRR